MKKSKKTYYIILLIIVILIISVNSIVICSVNPCEADYVYDLFISKYNMQKVDICILDYDYVTGASWRVEKSTNKEIENTYVLLNTICNPRDLKINKEFELDYLAKYVAVIDKNIEKTIADNEDIDIIKVEEIVITNFYYHNDGFDNIRFSELTVRGKVKSILAFFIPKLRLQM